MRSCYIEGTLKRLGANPGGCVSQAKSNAFDYAHGKAAVWPTGIPSVNRVAFEDNFFPCVQNTSGGDFVLQPVQAGYKTKQEKVKAEEP
jgi:hypothetical protein